MTCSTGALGSSFKMASTTFCEGACAKPSMVRAATASSCTCALAADTSVPMVPALPVATLPVLILSFKSTITRCAVFSPIPLTVFSRVAFSVLMTFISSDGESAEGTLYDSAEKAFRGTIDLKRGCAGSEGKEEENVLLLGDDVINKTIPLILCTEEDVKGSHGASIGELEQGMLFYFEARGISREEAEKIVAKARLERLCQDTEDAKTAEYMHQIIEEVI